MEALLVWNESQKNCDWWPKDEILGTLNVGVIGNKLCETAGNNESWEWVRRYTEFHDDYIDSSCSQQKRIDKLWDMAVNALETGDYEAYNNYKQLIKNLEEIPLIDALKK